MGCMKQSYTKAQKLCLKVPASTECKNIKAAVIRRKDGKGRRHYCSAFLEEKVEMLAGRQQTSQILVVAGDVKEGSSVSCEGDICVLGRLYGRAHAGSKGNSTALIKALQFCTDQIQISDKKVGEFIECEEPALLSCNSSGFLEMRCQGDAQEGADLREAFALVTIPDHEDQASAEETLPTPSTSVGALMAEESPPQPTANFAPEPVRVEQATTADFAPEPVTEEQTTTADFVPELVTVGKTTTAPPSTPPASLAKHNGLKKGVKKKQAFNMKNIRDAGPVAKLALFTGTYIAVVGLALLFAPVTCFTLLFDWRSVAPVWIRIGGVLAILFGFYYIGAAHGEVTRRGLRSFYEATVWGRAFLCVAFLALVAMRKSQWQLTILALVNLLGAVSMRKALQLP